MCEAIFTNVKRKNKIFRHRTSKKSSSHTNKNAPVKKGKEQIHKIIPKRRTPPKRGISYIFQTGKYKGRTLGEIIISDPPYINKLRHVYQWNFTVEALKSIATNNR